MADFLNAENLNKEWMIMNIYNHEYNIDGLFPNWVKSAMDSLTSGNAWIIFYYFYVFVLTINYI